MNARPPKLWPVFSVTITWSLLSSTICGGRARGSAAKCSGRGWVRALRVPGCARCVRARRARCVAPRARARLDAAGDDHVEVVGLVALVEEPLARREPEVLDRAQHHDELRVADAGILEEGELADARDHLLGLLAVPADVCDVGHERIDVLMSASCLRAGTTRARCGCAAACDPPLPCPASSAGPSGGQSSLSATACSPGCRSCCGGLRRRTRSSDSRASRPGVTICSSSGRAAQTRPWTCAAGAASCSRTSARFAWSSATARSPVGSSCSSFWAWML
eukprot:1506103-Prymnesium_polylepis.1